MLLKLLTNTLKINISPFSFEYQREYDRADRFSPFVYEPNGYYKKKVYARLYSCEFEKKSKSSFLSASRISYESC